MWDLVYNVYLNYQNYIFGSVLVTMLSLFLFMMGYMIVHNFSIETMLVMLFMGGIVTAVWLVPGWLIAALTVLASILIAWVLVKIIGGS